MDVDKIIEALRCTSAPGGPIEDCEKCPFWRTENLTPEQAKQLGTDTLSSCDVDRIGMDAADRLANDQTHIAALQKEIKKLRSGRRRIPVMEQLPEQMMKLFPSADIMRTPGVAGAVLCFCKDGTKNVMRYDFNSNAWVFRILNRVFYFDPEFVTHWMPLPEAPEVE